MDDCGNDNCGRCDVCIAGMNEYAAAEAVLLKHGMLPDTPRRKQLRKMRDLRQRHQR